jgi:hypothetical protein
LLLLNRGQQGELIVVPVRGRDDADRPTHLCAAAVLTSWRLLSTASNEADNFRRGNLMANDNKDTSILGHIDGLVKEEEQLYAKQELTDEDRGRLEKLKIELDQYWDLLRQRRALREFGRDPNQAKVRPPDVVEDYEQ